MMKNFTFKRTALSLFVLMICTIFSTNSFGQVTTSSISGFVKDDKGGELPGATIVAIHLPSGTKYGTVTNSAGHFTLPAVRVGGPYKIIATFVGFKDQVSEGISADLGSAANVNFKMADNSKILEDVVVKGSRSDIMSSDRTGATSAFGREAITRLPTLSRSINDVTKYSAYAGSGGSFAGQDSRFNSITVDGSVFNNGFGLGNDAMAGSRAGSTLIRTTAVSLDAVEQIQVNVAPFDIRQSGFGGAGINAVTRSGTNEFSGSVYGFSQNNNYVGTKAYGLTIPVPTFDQKTYGFRFGGPLIKDKLFFFLNGEILQGSAPALTWLASRPGETGNVSRTTADDIAGLATFMKTNFGYDAGAIDQYNNKVDSKKFLVRLDYNINDHNKLSVRYSFHNSTGDQLISNSNSSNTAGSGNRNNSATAISPQNTGYIAGDNTRSLAVELNSTFGSKFSNNLIGTFNKQIEDRQYRTGIFPTVDILNATGGTTYTSIGFDPFTPNNRLNYSTYNLTDNFNIYAGKHTLTLGAAFEYFNSNNLFYYASNGVWVYNSIADFETAALAYKANPTIVPGTTTSTVPIARFNYRYSLLPNGALPWQTLKAYTESAYAQDEYQVKNNFKVTLGLRADIVSYASTATDYYNPVVGGLTFKENGANYSVNTSLLPKTNLYLSPRFGFNWDVFNNKTTQVRGGTGLFLSRIPEVLVSNQLGNNGVNIGLVNVTGTAALKYPFTTDPSIYTPPTTDITKISGYNVNASDQNLKAPQIWKTNLAIDQRLPMGFIFTAEFLYNKFYNSLIYKDVNLADATSTMSGTDNRPRYPASGLSGTAATNARFINPAIGDVYVLSNVSQGYAYTATAKIERNVSRGFGGMLAYTYGMAKDVASLSTTVDATTAGTAGVNYLNPAYSNNDLRHRIVGYLNYRLEYGGKFGGATTFSLGMVSAAGGKISYTYGTTDLNGDGQGNDLLYVPKSATEMTFAAVTGSYKDAAGVTQTYNYTPAQQQAAYDAYINNNSYLSGRRGQYAERNAAYYPWLTRFDLSVNQDFFVKVGPQGKRNTISIRADILNVGNMINNKYGVDYVSTGTAPVTVSAVSAAGVPTYKLATQTINGVPVLIQDSFVRSAALTDVWKLQLGLRYTFN